MPEQRFLTGSVAGFDASWRSLPASERYHFKAGAPLNQLHFAFQSHWRVFQKVMGEIKGGKALEVGCGRGSMAAYFAHAGFETHLLDSSPAALDVARRNFEADGLTGVYQVGDALDLCYADSTFDVVVSIGLLEHFEDIEKVVAEQIRVLRPGGVFLGYVVPERRVSVQTLAAPLNGLLKLGHAVMTLFSSRRDSGVRKEPLYRNDYGSDPYLAVLDRLGVSEKQSFGMFPVPLVSHSPRFPFSFMHPLLERAVVGCWRTVLRLRPGKDAALADPARDPWTCSENWGLAFLVWARK